jgi:hypothetical protein
MRPFRSSRPKNRAGASHSRFRGQGGCVESAPRGAGVEGGQQRLDPRHAGACVEDRRGELVVDGPARMVGGDEGDLTRLDRLPEAFDGARPDRRVDLHPRAQPSAVAGRVEPEVVHAQFARRPHRQIGKLSCQPKARTGRQVHGMDMGAAGKPETEELSGRRQLRGFRTAPWRAPRSPRPPPRGRGRCGRARSPGPRCADPPAGWWAPEPPARQASGPRRCAGTASGCSRRRIS